MQHKSEAFSDAGARPGLSMTGVRTPNASDCGPLGGRV